ncbi:lipoyl domain-containing protein [Natronosalvus rutilus]|uniref:Lipoyl domain-containing protein n=1 Tax=Natronosalvus rutilus TaxID=2953753 RepID=A0A9E7NCM2_9EURY|nr:lipoyl domain-containing protein [Natronosalvus rutilus]UTF54499.1 lipoyl domain-containing protein [Natronosalvus rutilus]
MSVDLDSESIWPDDAEDVDEAVVATWFVREGASIAEGDTLCEIQIEKVSIDVSSPASGTLAEIRVGENEEFRRGDSLGRIESG